MITTFSRILVFEVMQNFHHQQWYLKLKICLRKNTKRRTKSWHLDPQRELMIALKGSGLSEDPAASAYESAVYPDEPKTRAEN